MGTPTKTFGRKDYSYCGENHLAVDFFLVCILKFAKIAKNPRFSEGYAWCVETIKQSVYAPLAIELEMNKAVDLLKQGDLQAATEALLAFNNKESKVASAAANNLAMLDILVS